MPAGVLSLILCYSFTQTHPEVNPLNLDKRLNQVLLLLFECTNEGIVTSSAVPERRHFKISSPSLGGKSIIMK